ncbi:MAG: GIY-YIG nuclease family protein [Proteobacteria bacterium]|nr:GIY-YIG nuclease family protein [Pseudomonadota bacterium]
MADQTSKKSNKELLDELGVEVESVKKAARSPREERIIAGFEEIQGFVEKNGHPPAHGENNDIFERLYATRLDQIRLQEECRSLVQKLDYQGLLEGAPCVAEPPAEYGSDAELLAELGVEAPKEGNVTFLKHVKPRAEVRRAAEEIGTRTPCEDFETFKPIFEAVQKELKNGMRITKRFKDKVDIREGDLFILFGQKIYIAKVGEEFITKYDRKNNKLRVIYDNGTESDILLRSLQVALNKDEAGRRIIDTTAGPLFSGVTEDEDLASGTIYVLQSKSEHPVIQKNRAIIHKIGVTRGSVKIRIAKAKLDPTYLMAEVEVVATYELYNINCSKLEHILHKIFDCAKLDIQINDRFGNPVVPQEWFFVPLFVIDEVVEKIKDGTISEYSYDVKLAALISAGCHNQKCTE